VGVASVSDLENTLLRVVVPANCLMTRNGGYGSLRNVSALDPAR